MQKTPETRKKAKRVHFKDSVEETATVACGAYEGDVPALPVHQ